MVKFTVIIPTYNRPKSIVGCLECLYQSRYPRDRFEIIVIDDGSDESYSEAMAEFPEVRWIQVSNGGPAAARNRGVLESRGEYLAFTDDDCYAHPDWLSQLERSLDEFPEALVGGLTPALEGAGLFDRVSQFICLIVYEHYNQDPKRSQFFASNNIALSRRVFDAVGGFEAKHTKNAAEDRTLCNHLISAGYRLVWNRDAVVFHYPQLTLSRFCRMYFRYGRGALTYQKSRKTGSMVAETGFHLHLPRLVWRLLDKEPTLPNLPTLGLLGVWQVCNVAGFAWQALQGDEF
jgi:glycosyltransferase involved in cell wall biosynthesis